MNIENMKDNKLRNTKENKNKKIRSTKKKRRLGKTRQISR